VRIIERGAADVMLAGGAESKTNPIGLSQYQVMGVLGDSSKPFDRDAKGFVIGEGAGFIVLEEYEHAKKRGAKIYAEVMGFGSSSASGRFEAMDSALAESGISAKELGYIQSCGLGLPGEDKLELEAIEVLSKSSLDIALTSLKPVTGFTGFAAGALDVVVSTLALQHQEIPPVLNLKNPLGFPKAQWVTGHSMKKDIRYALTNAFGLGSPCASLVTKRMEEK
jgi:3-oxoacyl-[acyl-carrier-protein] synthase II